MPEKPLNKNRRRYGKGTLVAGLSVGGLVFVIIKLVHILHGINELNTINKESQFKEVNSYIILIGSAGKKDTMQLHEYIEKNKLRTDSPAIDLDRH